MKRKLALDLGSKSCGFAISDALGITAQGLENYFYEENNWEQLLNRIEFHLLQYNYNVDTFVLGYPLMKSGSKSKTTLMVEEFKKILEKQFPNISIIYIDERETTKQAENIMIEAGLSRKKRKKHKDKLAAQIILQDYLMTI